jgi:protein-tyrosine phosphatase
MAEGLLRHALAAESAPLSELNIISAGVAAVTGSPASPNSVTAMKSVGLDITSHRAQQLTPELIEQATAVLVMTETHRAVIQASYDPTPRHIYLLREFMPREADKEIADPYGGPLPLYEACRDEIVEAIPSVIAHLREEIGG